MRRLSSMAIFSTSGGSFFGDGSPALNAYGFFEHTLRYTLSGEVNGNNWTPTYTSTVVSGVGRPVGGFPYNYRDVLTGVDLTVATAGGFALTGGTVTGFETGQGGGIGMFANGSFEEAEGFSIAATTFWSLASTSQWHALWLLASAGDDTMTGSNVASSADYIEGGAGSDTITARAGNDTLWGNAGRDFLYGGEDNDIVVCNDWAAGGVSALWSEGHGDAGDDYIFTGGYGSGALYGGAGIDRMWGGPQQDFLTGGIGIDYMAGGLGQDVFEVTAAGAVAGEYDFVLDFVDGVDFIKLPVGAAWNVGDSAFGAIISDPATGFYLIVQYATVATISDQIYYA